ncbi:hypothetical protein CDAR_57251 [Caerostris darwini]|uniref:Uncharacterized protein n=1 Tax=Caerostris darwini TaxID=1538125 RepID=A0AAV4TPD3_9ARAC|nr:hypothetical protein CDAR_57251 [Caerostris darwini]
MSRTVKRWNFRSHTDYRPSHPILRSGPREPQCQCRSSHIMSQSLSLSVGRGVLAVPPRPLACDFLFGSQKRRCEFNYTRWINLDFEHKELSSLVWRRKISYEWEDTDRVFARFKRVYRSVYCLLECLFESGIPIMTNFFI